MSTVPRLSRWSTFVRKLGGVVGLDIAWEERAWADFSDERDGPLDVICRLGSDGDLDVTVRPKLEGENIRQHRNLAKALAALAYVNPATAGDGETVSRQIHKGDWHQIDDDLAVAVAGNSGAGGVKTGGRGAYLVYKGRLWLPNGVQTPRDWPGADKNAEGRDADGEQIKPADEAFRERAAAVAETAEAANGRAPVSRPSRSVTENTVPFPSGPQGREPRSRIFGDETDALIQQARSRRRFG